MGFFTNLFKKKEKELDLFKMIAENKKRQQARSLMDSMFSDE